MPRNEIQDHQTASLLLVTNERVVVVVVVVNIIVVHVIRRNTVRVFVKWQEGCVRWNVLTGFRKTLSKDDNDGEWKLIVKRLLFANEQGNLCKSPNGLCSTKPAASQTRYGRQTPNANACAGPIVQEVDDQTCDEMSEKCVDVVNRYTNCRENTRKMIG